MTRAFVAVRPPEGVVDGIGRFVPSIDIASGRLTTREQWHVTLQFLGNRADVDAVAAALQHLSVPGASAQLGGLGAFPNAKRATVLWVGISTGSETFAALARDVGELLSPLGHEPDARRFHAHLTLARFKTPCDVREVVASGASEIGPLWPVDEVTVYESRTRPTGAEYIARAQLPLPHG